MKQLPRYVVYIKHRNCKRAQPNGIYTDDLDWAKESADRNKMSWWGVNGIYEWVKVKDAKTNKYIYEA